MATFTKTTQNALGLLNVGAGVFNALRTTSRITTPLNNQREFNNIRNATLSNIRRYGVQKTNLAYLNIQIPQILSQAYKSSISELLLLASTRGDTFPLPGSALATSEIKRYGIGPVEKKPYLTIFNDITVDFIADSSGNIHKLFYMWMNSIINFTDLPRQGGKRDSFAGNTSTGKDPFTVEFKDEYKTRIVLRTFDEQQQLLADIFLENAFPVSLGEIQYNWNNESQLVRFPVTFNFTHWTYDLQSANFGFVPPRAENSNNQTNWVYQLLINYYPAIQALELASRKPQQVQDVLNIVNAGQTNLSPLTRYF
jgi:hypothetical protein